MADSTKTQFITSVKNRLNRLGCPYTEGVEDDSWIPDLIYTPGEPRIKLLQWLFLRTTEGILMKLGRDKELTVPYRFDSQLQDVLEAQHASTESRMDSRIQRLLFVASSLGLCHAEDVDLIRGITSGVKQDAFLNHLLDIVCTCDDVQMSGDLNDTDSIDDQYNRCTEYVDRLVSEHRVDTLLTPKVNLLPPDLMKKYEAACMEQGYQLDKPPKPDLQSIQEQIDRLEKDLERQMEILKELNKVFDYKESDESQRERVSRTTSLALSELSQLLTGFSYCFQNEMRHWCNKTPPDLTQLGPAFKRVHQSLPGFLKLLGDYRTIRGSYTKLSRDGSERLQKAVQDSDATKLGASAESKLRMYEEWAAVLEDSIHRQHRRTLRHTQALWDSLLKIP